MILSPSETYNYVKEVGIKKSKKVWSATLCSAILAGMFIALGGFAAAMASHAIPNYSLAKLVSGFIFPVGLILVVICGAELFTGNNLLGVALFEKEITLKNMIRNWVHVYIGNFIGSILIGVLLYYSNALDGNGGALGGYAIKVAANKASLNMTTAFFKGILCNILVCMSVWGSYAARSAVGKVFMLHIPVMAFIISGFEHSVANMYYFTIGFLAKSNQVYIEASHLTMDAIHQISIGNVIHNLIPVTLGNIVGGTIIVCGLYYLIAKAED